MFSPKDKQIYAFEEQIKLAKELNIKLYLHCRDAYDDLIHIIKKYNYFNGLIHCFTGNIIQAIEFTKLGFKLGITGWLLDKRRNKDLQDVISHPEITIDMLVIETDAPFMPLYPKKESTPSDLWIVLEEIAKIKNMDLNVVGEKIYDNSVKFLSR
jgi:TatD DNase family protein